MEPITVLLADDHAVVRKALAGLVKQAAGLVLVGEAEDGRSAVRLACEHGPRVVLMDVAMPELSGVEATRRLSIELPATRVLAISMNGDARFVEAMLEAGAAGYLLKEDAAEELVQAVHAVAGGGSYTSRGLAGPTSDD